MYNGIINIYKEKGYTSHDVVAKLRGILRQKKIGHTGTLDPEATGVLPVCLGKATKLCDMLTDRSKTYKTTMVLGITTDTQDMTGKVIKNVSKEEVNNLKKEDIVDTIMSFLGEYMQTPPMYSALKVNGKKLYELARAGIEIERQQRKQEILNIDIISINIPEVTFSVTCSKGTYIRTLCNDVGEKLNVGACMKSLERTQVSIFLLEEALRLDEVIKLRDEEKLEDVIYSVESMFKEYDKIVLKPEDDRFLYNGNKLDLSLYEDIKTNDSYKQVIRVYDSFGVFYAIYAYLIEENKYKVTKFFGAD